MQRYAVVHFTLFVYVFRIGCPHEIMHIRCFEFPGKLGCSRSLNDGSLRFIPVSDLEWVLQITGSTQYIIFIDGDVHLEVAPNAVKLSTHIGGWMPSLIIVFAELRIPLTHRVTNFRGRIVSSAATDLQGHLSFKLHIQFYLGAG